MHCRLVKAVKNILPDLVFHRLFILLKSLSLPCPPSGLWHAPLSRAIMEQHAQPGVNDGTQPDTTGKPASNGASFFRCGPLSARRDWGGRRAGITAAAFGRDREPIAVLSVCLRGACRGVIRRERNGAAGHRSRRSYRIVLLRLTPVIPAN